ncbi:MAG TPA: ABC transporter transmembrane domain-containing protein, partial [Chthoniobacterales bacterium]|nr:ABC transporter transmembrane domain-containing protein [Chthoniobacterales bacterium]
MQGKPPPNQAAQGPPSSPSGMAPQSSPGQVPPPPAGGLIGKAPTDANAKPRGRGGSGAQLSDVRWGMIFKMGWQLMGFFKVLVISYALVTLLQNCVTLGTSQLLGEVTNSIKGRGGPPVEATETAHAPATAPANANAASTAAQPPAPEEPRKNPLVLLGLWAAFALIALGVRLPLRAVATKLDLAMSNKLRSQLFARLLRQSPEFYHKHETGELNAVVNQFAVEATMTLRQVSLDVILQVITLGITVGLLIYNFDMKPAPTLFGMTIPPWLIPLAITLFAFISPWMTGKMANKVRDVSRDLQEKMVALNSLVTGAMQSPEEIQAMEAEPMFMTKHDKQLDSLLKSRLKSTVTMEYMSLFSGLPSWIVEVVMLAFGVYFAYSSGDSAAAGKVVAIFLLTPSLMTPIQGLSAYILMAGNAWPAIDT